MMQSLKNSPTLNNRSLLLELENRQDDLSHPYYWAAFTLIGIESISCLVKQGRVLGEVRESPVVFHSQPQRS